MRAEGRATSTSLYCGGAQKIVFFPFLVIIAKTSVFKQQVAFACYFCANHAPAVQHGP